MTVILRDEVRRRLLGPEFERALHTGDAWQWAQPDELARLQWDSVRELVRLAYGLSPYYRPSIQAAGWPEISPESFARIPLLTRSALVRHASEIQTMSHRPLLSRTSGGSSGAVVPVPVSRSLYAWYIAGTSRGFTWWDVSLWDRGTVLLGPRSGSVLRRAAMRTKDWSMNWMRCDIDQDFDRVLPDFVEQADRYRPVFVYGYPSAVDRLASAVRGRPALRDLKLVVLTGEPVYEFQRRRISETFGCPVVEEYGAGEVGSVAFTCRAGAMHVASESVYVEGQADQGTAGPILVTHLRNTLFPLIRYHTGDMGSIEDSKCPCGRGLPVLRIAGRLRDRLTGAQGEALPARPALEQIFQRIPQELLGRVQLTHTRPGVVVLRVAASQRPSGMDGLVASVEEVLGRDWKVAAVTVPHLRRLPSGKLPLFIRQRTPA